MILRQYTLPDWEFIGGTTQSYEFKLKTEEGYTYDIQGATASIAVAPFVNQNDVLYSATADIQSSKEDNGSYCLVSLELPVSKTVAWNGKYIYQVTVKTEDGKAISAQRGRMFVTKNFDGSFVSGAEVIE